MRRKWAVVGTVVLCLTLAACGHAPAGPPPAAEPVVGDPVVLLGSWTVTGAHEEAGAVLRLAPDRAELVRACGVTSGPWRADTGGLFVGELDSAAGGCPPSSPGWLTAARSFRADGDRRLLLDANGAVVARLEPGASPPVVSDEVRRTFGRSDPLPAGLEPAPPTALVGKWTPARVPDGTPGRAYVELRGDGGWTGSDGCNDQGGRWVAGPHGALVAVAGPSTLVGCDGVAVGAWLANAGRAALDGDVLVLFDAHGKETGRLQRA